MVELHWDGGTLAALVTLTALEIVLGIDNLIIVAILTDGLPESPRSRARRLGLAFALAARIGLLSLAFIVAQFDEPIFSVGTRQVSWRDILLISGGLFLLTKGTIEIHEKVEDAGRAPEPVKTTPSLLLVVLQIVAMDMIFSFDSIMTAIGIVEQLPVMITAILISMGIKVLAVDRVAGFLTQHPTIKILGLSYLLLIGIALIGEGFGMEILKGYLYFAMAFSFFVEMINMRIRRRTERNTPTV